MSAYFSGSLVEQYGSTTVFVLTAVFPLIVSASALLIDEQRVPARQQAAAAAVGAGRAQQQQQKKKQKPQHVEQLALSNASSSSSGSSGLVQQLVNQGGALWGAVKQKHILLPTVFVFLWQVSALAAPLFGLLNDPKCACLTVRDYVFLSQATQSQRQRHTSVSASRHQSVALAHAPQPAADVFHAHISPLSAGHTHSRHSHVLLLHKRAALQSRIPGQGAAGRVDCQPGRCCPVQRRVQVSASEEDAAGCHAAGSGAGVNTGACRGSGNFRLEHTNKPGKGLRQAQEVRMQSCACAHCHSQCLARDRGMHMAGWHPACWQAGVFAGTLTLWLPLSHGAGVVLAVLLQLLLVSGANRALGLSDELFVLGDSVILTVLGQVSFMPILVLAGGCSWWGWERG